MNNLTYHIKYQFIILFRAMNNLKLTALIISNIAYSYLMNKIIHNYSLQVNRVNVLYISYLEHMLFS